MEFVLAAQLNVVITFLDEPFADLARLILCHTSLIDWIVLCLDLKCHLVDNLRLELLGWRRPLWH